VFFSMLHSREGMTLKFRWIQATTNHTTAGSLLLDRLTAVQDGLTDLITPETVVCRCEEVTAGEVLEVLDEGAVELGEIKRMTRAGMGLCQGRMCSPALAVLLARRTGRRPETLDPPSVRPPVKPVPIEVLATLPDG